MVVVSVPAPIGPFLVRLAFADDGSPAGHCAADAAAPQLSVLDLGVTRGDGIFETISIGNSRLQALEPHLLRFAHSAAMLELPIPDAAQWRAAITEAAAHLDAASDGPVVEGFVKIVMTRGVENGSGSLLPAATAPTGWALAAVSPDHTAARRDGIRIVLLDRGYRHDIAQTAPWLLAGAKTLSYATNRSAFREAARRGADDALFVSSDGFLLEGAVSNLVLRRGGRCSRRAPTSASWRAPRRPRSSTGPPSRASPPSTLCSPSTSCRTRMLRGWCPAGATPPRCAPSTGSSAPSTSRSRPGSTASCAPARGNRPLSHELPGL